MLLKLKSGGSRTASASCSRLGPQAGMSVWRMFAALLAPFTCKINSQCWNAAKFSTFRPGATAHSQSFRNALGATAVSSADTQEQQYVVISHLSCISASISNAELSGVQCCSNCSRRVHQAELLVARTCLVRQNILCLIGWYDWRLHGHILSFIYAVCSYERMLCH